MRDYISFKKQIFLQNKFISSWETWQLRKNLQATFILVWSEPKLSAIKNNEDE